MDYHLDVKRLASVEVLEAYSHYESQKTDLGDEFLEEVEQSLLQNPEVYSFYQKPIRQGRIKRFPFLKLYEVDADEIVVYSVFNTNRDPAEKLSQL